MKKKFLIPTLFIFSLFAFSFFGARGVEAADTKAPTIINADLQNKHVRWGRPIVVGLTENGTDVLVYINEKFAGEAKINNGKDIDNFYFQPAKPLNPGTYSIQVVARKKSDSSVSAKSQKSFVTVNGVGSATLLENNGVVDTGKPIIGGKAVAGTVVDVFIDGKLYGRADVKKTTGPVSDFSYIPFLNLKKGEHKVYTVAKTEDGKFKSKPSNEIVLRVESPLPAPVLVRTVVNRNTDKIKPFITGVVKSGLMVKVYINGEYDGEIKPSESKTGASNFAYKPNRKMDQGSYKITSISIDSRGKKSKNSNQLNYFNRYNKPQISKKAVTETVAVDKKNDEKTKIEVIKNDTGTSTEALDKGKILGDTVVDIIKGSGTASGTKEGGAVNEQNEQQGKIKPSLIIFISFLLIVIGWIIWVNKELVKKDESENKNEPDKKA